MRRSVVCWARDLAIRYLGADTATHDAFAEGSSPNGRFVNFSRQTEGDLRSLVPPNEAC